MTDERQMIDKRKDRRLGLPKVEEELTAAIEEIAKADRELKRIRDDLARRRRADLAGKKISL